MNFELCPRSQYNKFKFSRDIFDLLFCNATGMPWYAWPYLVKIILSGCCLHEYLTICLRSITKIHQKIRRFRTLWASSSMPRHIRQKFYDQHIVYINVYIHLTQINNSNLSCNIWKLLFQGRFGKVRRAWIRPTNITWLRPSCSFH